MLQRIQTIFLALVVILGVLFFIVPIMEFTGYEFTYLMNYNNTALSTNFEVVITEHIGVGVMEGLILLVAVSTIFLFKNRSLQMKLGKLNILLIAFQIAAIVMYSDTVRTDIGPNANDVSISFKLGAIIPVISLILTYLAIRFIKKDDNLVKAADRLR